MKEKFLANKPPQQPSPWWKRFIWLVVIWFGSVMSLGIIAYLLRKLMTAAGMSS